MGLAGGGVLLALAALSLVLAFPKSHGLLQTAGCTGVLWGLLGALAAVALRALWKRRWVSALFHAGALCLVVGGALSAGHAKTWEVWLEDSPFATPEMRQRVVKGELVTLERFEIERYENGMPKQFRTTLRFPDGLQQIEVNRPLRRKGLTYYQMSYHERPDAYGQPVRMTMLLLREDPGWPVVFSGYGLLAAAALLLAVRTERG